MVSFSCEACGDVLTKKKLDPHRNQCRGATYTCLDCMVHFQGTDYRSHTSCISEAQKYQGSLYRDKKSKVEKRRSTDGYDQAMVPRRAYVEDAPDGDDSQAIAVIDVPPKAPSPPPASAGAIPDNVNVFDFLVTEDTPNASRTSLHAPDGKHTIEHHVHYANGDSHHSHYQQYSQDKPQYVQHGFTYGHTPVPPSNARYDSWHDLNEAQQAQHPFVTPAPKEHKKEKKEKHVSMSQSVSDKKRKRHQVDDLDLSTSKRPPSRDATMTDAPTSRVLHSGLTGGLTKLVTDPEFFEDRIDPGPTPIVSPKKRSRRDDADQKAERRKSSYVGYATVEVKPSTSRHDERREKKYHEDRHERRYHEDTHQRSRSADRNYREDHHRSRRPRESVSSEDRPNGHRSKHLKAIEHEPIERPRSVQPNALNQVVTYKSYSSRAELFMSFINKGPDSERGCSINKVLKRFHRERDVRSDAAKEDEDKELWKNLRLRRNDRGEIVLFI